jgi:hypothetical protein
MIPKPQFFFPRESLILFWVTIKIILVDPSFAYNYKLKFSNYLAYSFVFNYKLSFARKNKMERILATLVFWKN